MGYFYLALAIIAEVIATSALAASDGFSKPVPSMITVIGYCISFYTLSLVLKTIPVGIAYAVWSGMGIVLVTLIAVFVFQQTVDLPAILGMAMIIAGVVTIQLFSKTAGH